MTFDKITFEDYIQKLKLEYDEEIEGGKLSFMELQMYIQIKSFELLKEIKSTVNFILEIK
jgi:hypothetical protein